jgi:hypothetical protein
MKLGATLAGSLMMLAALQSEPARAAARPAGDDPEPQAKGLISIAAPEGRGWELGANLRTLYDSNILRLGDGQAPGPNQESKSDFRISPSVSGAIATPIGRQQVYFGGELGRDFYARNTNLNRNRYVLGGGLNWRLGRSCNGGLGAEFRRRQNLLSDVDGTIDNVQRQRSYAASFDCAASIGPSVGGTFHRNETDNDNPQRSAFDVRSNTYELHLGYGSPTLGRFQAGATLNDVKYPHRSVLTPNGGGGIDSVEDAVKIWNFRGGYSRGLGTRLTLNAGLSYIKVNPKPSLVLQPIAVPGGFLLVQVPRNGYDGLGYDLSIDYNSGSRLSAGISATQQATSTANVGALYVLDKAFSAYVDYSLNNAITVGGGVIYNDRNYRGGVVSTGQPQRVSDKITRVYGYVSYAPRPLYSIDLEVGHQNRDSVPSIYNYNSTTVTLGLRVRFGRHQ